MRQRRIYTDEAVEEHSSGLVGIIPLPSFNNKAVYKRLNAPVNTSCMVVCYREIPMLYVLAVVLKIGAHEAIIQPFTSVKLTCMGMERGV